MTRLLTTLAGLFAVLVLLEHYAVEREAAREALYGTLRPLASVAEGDVAQIVAQAGNGRTWRYVRVDSSWRYPDYHYAFVQPQRIEHLLNSLLQAASSIASVEGGDLPHYGFMANSPLLTLLDAQGTPLLTARLGRGAPDVRASESYVQLAGADTIYHLHANPAHAFDGGDPPMLDRRIRPRALQSRAVDRISFSQPSPIRSLYREEREAAMPEMPGAPPSGPTYAWIGEFADGARECVAPSAYAYIGFLDRLTWSELRDPAAQAQAFNEARALYIAAEEGSVDTLEISSLVDGVYLLRYRTTGQVFAIPGDKADLLFPTPSALLDSLSKPNAYEQVEPYTPF